MLFLYVPSAHNSVPPDVEIPAYMFSLLNLLQYAYETCISNVLIPNNSLAFATMIATAVAVDDECEPYANACLQIPWLVRLGRGVRCVNVKPTPAFVIVTDTVTCIHSIFPPRQVNGGGTPT